MTWHDAVGFRGEPWIIILGYCSWNWDWEIRTPCEKGSLLSEMPGGMAHGRRLQEQIPANCEECAEQKCLTHLSQHHFSCVRKNTRKFPCTISWWSLPLFSAFDQRAKVDICLKTGRALPELEVPSPIRRGSATTKVTWVLPKIRAHETIIIVNAVRQSAMIESFLDCHKFSEPLR